MKQVLLVLLLPLHASIFYLPAANSKEHTFSTALVFSQQNATGVSLAFGECTFDTRGRGK